MKEATKRIGQTSAEIAPLPEMDWRVREVQWLLDQETFQKNYKDIPINNELYESIDKHGMIAPILTMSDWYPIAGSQRLRVCQAIRELRPSHKVLSQKVRVARITNEVWHVFHLWPEKEFVSKAIQVYFQCIEVVWKTRYYIYETDFSGVSMEHFESVGDKLKWKARDGE